MARRRTSERTVFLAWERQGTLLHRLGFSRTKPFLWFTVVLLTLTWLVVRDLQQSKVRATRATLLVARRAIDDFRADHDGACPTQGMNELVTAKYLTKLPRDAWESPIELECPSRRHDKTYDLFSNGPDHEPGGLDRVE